MLSASSLLALAALAASTSASPLPPVWARGGRLFREFSAREAAREAALGILRNGSANTFDQLVDHRNPARGTFAQRFFFDTSSYQAGGPIFLYIGGEGPTGGTPGGYVSVLAAAHKALIVTLEHRYYGESMPGALTDKALFTSTLSVEQSLADLAAFVPFFEASLGGPPHTWLVIGGSYAGALSAWLREVHPELVAASWSSSGVVEAIFNYTDFDAQIVRDVSPACADALRGATALAEAAWASPAARARMLALFNAPTSLSQVDFLWAIADSIAMGPQYGAKAALCAAMLPVGSDPLAQLAAWTDEHYGPDFMSQCYYNTACLSDPSQASRWPNQLPWVWQCCSELAYWQPGYTGSIRSQLITTEYFVKQCQAAFYPTTSPDTAAFNSRFRGYANNATRVVALSGSDDPWRGACVNSSRPAQQYPFALAVCDGCGHCGDLHAPAPGDAPSLTAQRALIAASVAAWIA